MARKKKSLSLVRHVDFVAFMTAVFLCMGPIVLAGTGGSKALNPNQKRGKALYKTNCSSCHGLTGRGDGRAAQSLNPPPRSFEKTLPRMKRDKAVEIVLEGKGQMPGWSNVLSAKDVDAILDYLEHLYPKSK